MYNVDNYSVQLFNLVHKYQIGAYIHVWHHALIAFALLTVQAEAEVPAFL